MPEQVAGQIKAGTKLNGIQSHEEFPPRQKADTLSIKKELEETMKKFENPTGSNN